jgi:hypothetical protein
VREAKKSQRACSVRAWELGGGLGGVVGRRVGVGRLGGLGVGDEENLMGWVGGVGRELGGADPRE